MKITFDELFGFEGLIPLDMCSGVGDAVCPYCRKLIRHINFPPPGVIILHSCPLCGGLIVPFLKKLVAINKDKVSNNGEEAARKHITDCLFHTITPILMTYADRVITGETSLKEFLDCCWDIVYELVGEKEDTRTFLDKLKKRVDDNRGHRLAKEYEDYYERISETFSRVRSTPGGRRARKCSKFDIGKPRRDNPISTDELIDLNLALKDCNSVDDVLRKIGDSSS